jgi:hypothetical protein
MALILTIFHVTLRDVVRSRHHRQFELVDRWVSCRKGRQAQWLPGGSIPDDVNREQYFVIRLLLAMNWP